MSICKIVNIYFYKAHLKNQDEDIMVEIIDQKEKQRLRYALKDKNERKYMKYLYKRYGKKRAEMFSHKNQ